MLTCWRRHAVHDFRRTVMTEWAFDDNLFEVESPEEINLEAFADAMELRTFACIRGLVSPQSMYSAYDRIVQGFDRSKIGRAHV